LEDHAVGVEAVGVEAVAAMGQRLPAER
jgi:hypothetical protein